MGVEFAVLNIEQVTVQNWYWHLPVDQKGQVNRTENPIYNA